MKLLPKYTIDITTNSTHKREFVHYFHIETLKQVDISHKRVSGRPRYLIYATLQARRFMLPICHYYLLPARMLLSNINRLIQCVAVPVYCPQTTSHLTAKLHAASANKNGGTDRTEYS